MAYKVTRPIPKGDGTVIPAGTIVDASSWRNVRALVSNRWLVPLVETESLVDYAPVSEVKEEPVRGRGRKRAAAE